MVRRRISVEKAEPVVVERSMPAEERRGCLVALVLIGAVAALIAAVAWLIGL